MGIVAVAIGGMFSAVLLARSLSISNFGIHSALVSIMVLLATTGDFGISSALVYFIPKIKSKQKYSRFLSMAFWFQLSITLILGVIIMVLNKPLRSLLVPDSTAIHFVWVALLILVSSVNGFVQAIIRAKRRFLIVTLMQFAESVGKLLILTYLYLQHILTIETALIAAMFAIIVSITIGFSNEYKHIKLIFPLKQFKELFKFAKWIGVQRIFTTISSRVDVILLTSLSTSFYAGIFSAASRITMLFVILAGSINNVISPRFSSFKSRFSVKDYLKKLFLLETGLSFLMLLVAIFIPNIISLVFGPKYQSAIPVFRFLSIAMIPYLFTSTITNSLIFFFKETNFAMKVSAIQVFLIITLEVILIPHYHALAPAISLLVVNSFSLLLVGQKLVKLLNKKSL